MVHRTPICGLSYLNPAISTYHKDLAAAVPHWSTSKSPARLVNISSGYKPTTDTYDGLHPNGLGNTSSPTRSPRRWLATSASGRYRAAPARVPGITLTTPASMSASIVGTGLLLRWGRVYGASGYKIFERDITGRPNPPPAFTELPHSQCPETTTMPDGEHPATPTSTRLPRPGGTANPTPSSPATITMPASEPLADPPADVTVTPSQGTTSVTLTWSAPSSGPFDNTITGYDVFWLDTNPPCPGFALQGAQTTQTSHTISGLTPDHTYNLALASLDAAGIGPWTAAPPVIAGEGAPAAPTVSAASGNELSWPAVSGAAGYWIYQANPSTPPDPPTWTRLPYEVPQGWNGTLAPGTYEVTAANGTLESAPSNQVTLPPAAGAAAARASGRGALNPLGWIPAWLGAAPNAALTHLTQDDASIDTVIRIRH